MATADHTVRAIAQIYAALFAEEIKGAVMRRFAVQSSGWQQTLRCATSFAARPARWAHMMAALPLALEE